MIFPSAGALISSNPPLTPNLHVRLAYLLIKTKVSSQTSKIFAARMASILTTKLQPPNPPSSTPLL